MSGKQPPPVEHNLGVRRNKTKRAFMPDRAERRLRGFHACDLLFFPVALFSEKFLSDVSTDDLLHVLFTERAESSDTGD